MIISNKKNNFIHTVKNCFLYVLLFYGLFQSFWSSLFIWNFDSDIAAIPIFIKEFQEHGMGFLRDFHFPLDNWFFTILLPDALLVQISGGAPRVMMMTGVVAFWVTALLGGGVVGYLSGPKRGLWVTALILCASPMALGRGGYLTYPIAHNVSVLWGLAALWLILVWIRQRKLWALLGSTVILAVASFSDPWMLPTTDLPILCAASLTLLWQKKDASDKLYGGLWWWGIVGAVFTSLLLYKTHFLGAIQIGSDNFHSFTKVRFSLMALPNIFGALSFYFNFIPGMFGGEVVRGDIIPAGGKLLGMISVMLVNGTILIWAMYVAGRSFFKKIASYNKETVFLFLFLWISIFAIFASSFVFGGMRHMSSSRYLVNIYCDVIMVCLMIPGSVLTSNFKIASFGAISLWVISGVLSNISLWQNNILTLYPRDESFLSILRDEHIDTAYGSYWGAEANALTWLSHETVHVRPLLYEPDYHGFLPSIWTSPSWYKLKSHTRWALIITTTDGNDVCNPFPTCEDAAIHQFGKPVAVRQAERAIFMIYESDRTSLPYAFTVNTWQTPLPLPGEEAFSGWKSFYPNTHMNRDDLVTLEGWDEPKYGKVATMAPLARVGIPVPFPGHDSLTVRFLLKSSTARTRDVDVWYKGKMVAQWQFGAVTATRGLVFPLEAGQRFVNCDLVIRNPEQGKHGRGQGVILSEVQVVDDK